MMLLRIEPIFLSILLAAVAGFAEEAQPPREWSELFARDDPAASTRQIDSVLSACDDDPNRLRALIERDVSYRAMRPGWLSRTASVGAGDERYDAKFFIRIPRGYDPERSYPLLLAAHGKEGDGKSIGAMMLHLLGGQAENYVIVAPNLPGPRHFSGRDYQEEAFLNALAWARVHLNIDDDRIYVSGYSLGGHMGWHLATMFPHLFAGAVPMAGVPWFEGAKVTSTLYLENLANLHLWAIWGEKDAPDPPALGNANFCRAAAARLKELGNEKFKGTELKGVGHAGCLPEPGQMGAYLAAHVRSPVPEQFVHVFHLAHHARGYYLEAIRLAHAPIDFTKRIRVQVRVELDTIGAGQEDASRAIEKHIRKHLFRMRGRLDRGSNTLTILPRAMLTVRLYVIEGMFDLSRPVTIRFWSRKWTGRIPTSARCLLSHYAAARDRTALVHNEIDLDISGKVTVRYE